MGGSSHFSIKPRCALHTGLSSTGPYFTVTIFGQFVKGTGNFTLVLEGDYTNLLP